MNCSMVYRCMVDCMVGHWSMVNCSMVNRSMVNCSVVDRGMMNKRGVDGSWDVEGRRGMVNWGRGVVRLGSVVWLGVHYGSVVGLWCVVRKGGGSVDPNDGLL